MRSDADIVNPDADIVNPDADIDNSDADIINPENGQTKHRSNIVHVTKRISMLTKTVGMNVDDEANLSLERSAVDPC